MAKSLGGTSGGYETAEKFKEGQMRSGAQKVPALPAPKTAAAINKAADRVLGKQIRGGKP
jgi:hypothetical protein